MPRAGNAKNVIFILRRLICDLRHFLLQAQYNTFFQKKTVMRDCTKIVLIICNFAQNICSPVFRTTIFYLSSVFVHVFIKYNPFTLQCAKVCNTFTLCYFTVLKHAGQERDYQQTSGESANALVLQCFSVVISNFQLLIGVVVACFWYTKWYTIEKGE